MAPAIGSMVLDFLEYALYHDRVANGPIDLSILHQQSLSIDMVALDNTSAFIERAFYNQGVSLPAAKAHWGLLAIAPVAQTD